MIRVDDWRYLNVGDYALVCSKPLVPGQRHMWRHLGLVVEVNLNRLAPYITILRNDGERVSVDDWNFESAYLVQSLQDCVG